MMPIFYISALNNELELRVITARIYTTGTDHRLGLSVLGTPLGTHVL